MDAMQARELAEETAIVVPRRGGRGASARRRGDPRALRAEGLGRQAVQDPQPARQRHVRHRAAAAEEAARAASSMGSRPFEHLHVTATGTAVLCCQDYYEKLTVGDLKTQSVAEILGRRHDGAPAALDLRRRGSARGLPLPALRVRDPGLSVRRRRVLGVVGPRAAPSRAPARVLRAFGRKTRRSSWITSRRSRARGASGPRSSAVRCAGRGCTWAAATIASRAGSTPTSPGRSRPGCSPTAPRAFLSRTASSRSSTARICSSTSTSKAASRCCAIATGCCRRGGVLRILTPDLRRWSRRSIASRPAGARRGASASSRPPGPARRSTRTCA